MEARARNLAHGLAADPTGAHPTDETDAEQTLRALGYTR